VLENFKATNFEDQNIRMAFIETVVLSVDELGVDAETVVIKNITESAVLSTTKEVLYDETFHHHSLQVNIVSSVTITYYVEFNAVDYDSAEKGFLVVSNRLISAVENGNFTDYLHEFSVVLGVSDSYENTTATSVEILVNLVPTPSPTDRRNRNHHNKGLRNWQIAVIVVACVIGCIMLTYLVVLTYNSCQESRQQRTIRPIGVVVGDPES
jgi:hypothetical protein